MLCWLTTYYSSSLLLCLVSFVASWDGQARLLLNVNALEQVIENTSHDNDNHLLSRFRDELNQMDSSDGEYPQSGRQLASSCSTVGEFRSLGETKSAFGFKVVFKNNDELLVGAPMLGNGVGRVFHLTKNQGSWAQSNAQSVAQTLPSDKGQFGYEIAISHDGTIAAVGQPGDNASKGAVWLQEYFVPFEFPTFTKVTLPTGSFGQFGYSIAVHPTVLLVGAFEESSVASGVVFCFVRSTILQPFSHVQTLYQPVAGATAHFGFSIVLYPSGSMAVISAPGLNNNKGSVYRYTSNVGNAWVQQSTISDTITQSNQRFGYCMTVNNDGNQLFIGSPALEVSPNDFIYTTGVRGTFPMYAESAGYSVAVDTEGYAMIAGEPNVVQKRGQAERFYLSQPTVDRSIISSLPSQAGQWAGYSVGMSPSGDIKAVGIPLELNNGLTGSVFILACPARTGAPSQSPSKTPSKNPSRSPTTSRPSNNPTTPQPSNNPSTSPTTSRPSKSPSASPTTSRPSRNPTTPQPSNNPSVSPTTSRPSKSPSRSPSKSPSRTPSLSPTTKQPSTSPTTSAPSTNPSKSPTTSRPSKSPSHSPTKSTFKPSQNPTKSPSKSPSKSPTTSVPTKSPTTSFPTKSPSKTPSRSPSRTPSTSKPSRTPSISPSRSPVEATFAPSLNPTMNFDPRCIGYPGMTKAQCTKQNNKVCQNVKSPMKWTGRACKAKNGKRANDGGCRCNGFCAYTCKGRCNGDSQCYWSNNACYRRGSNLLNGSCEGK